LDQNGQSIGNTYATLPSHVLKERRQMVTMKTVHGVAAEQTPRSWKQMHSREETKKKGKISNRLIWLIGVIEFRWIQRIMRRHVSKRNKSIIFVIIIGHFARDILQNDRTCFDDLLVNPRDHLLLRDRRVLKYLSMLLLLFLELGLGRDFKGQSLF
jgi:hypothetical protein